jgi:hypothetical protein
MESREHRLDLQALLESDTYMPWTLICDDKHASLSPSWYGDDRFYLSDSAEER